MADYLKIAHTALNGAPKSAGAGEIEARSEPAEIPPTSALEEREHTNTILGRAGLRLMALEGGVTVGIWSDLDSAELRTALAVFHPSGIPPILYLDSSGIPDKYKERRVAGEPVPRDVLHAMEKTAAAPWTVRDQMLKQIRWHPKGIQWRG